MGFSRNCPAVNEFHRVRILQFQFLASLPLLDERHSRDATHIKTLCTLYMYTLYVYTSRNRLVYFIHRRNCVAYVETDADLM